MTYMNFLAEYLFRNYGSKMVDIMFFAKREQQSLAFDAHESWRYRSDSNSVFFSDFWHFVEPERKLRHDEYRHLSYHTFGDTPYEREFVVAGVRSLGKTQRLLTAGRQEYKDLIAAYQRRGETMPLPYAPVMPTQRTRTRSAPLSSDFEPDDLAFIDECLVEGYKATELAGLFGNKYTWQKIAARKIALNSDGVLDAVPGVVIDIAPEDR